MPRCLIPHQPKIGEVVSLSTDETHHLTKVLRCQPGTDLEIISLEGGLYEGRLEKTVQNKATVRIIEKILTPVVKGKVTLLMAVIKKDKMEWVMQKATELGVHHIIPVITERTVAKKEGSNVHQRWQTIAQESVKQCGRPKIPAIETIQTLKEAMSRYVAPSPPEECRMVLWEEEKKPARPHLESIRSENKITNVVCLIGPEGGLSAAELELCRQHGFTSLSLGQYVMRAETAAISTLTLVQYVLGNLE